MRREGDVKCPDSRPRISTESVVMIEPDCKRMKADVLMEMGLAVLDDDEDESSTGTKPQNAIAVRSPYSRAEPMETRLLNNVSKDITTFSNPFVDEFLLYRRQKSTGQARQDYFQKLSDEMVLSVFRLLPKKTLTRCAHVCRRWRRIAYDEELWVRVDLGSKTLPHGSLAFIVQRGVRILRLAQADIHDPVFAANVLPEGFCSRLQYLDLSMAVIPEHGLATLLQTTKHLIKLSLEHCLLNNNVCEAIGQNSQLEVLNLSMCYNITDICLETIMRNCRRIVSLNLAWTNLSVEALDLFLTCLPPQLHQLNISGCRNTLTDRHVRLLVKGCPLLTDLDLSDTLITRASIDLLCSLGKLEHLSLSRCYNISRGSLFPLSSILTLRSLNVFQTLPEEEGGICALVKGFPGVEINKHMFSSIARPTVGIRRTSVWGLRARD